MGRGVHVWPRDYPQRDDIAFLFKPARRLSREFHAALWAFAAEVRDAKANDLIDVPNWEARYGVSVHDVVAMLPGGDSTLRDDERAAVQDVFHLAGKAARVWLDNDTGAALLNYRDTLPEDLAPLLVLDASRRVRHMYVDMEQHRGLARLRSCDKNYSPLRVRVWREGGGKAICEIKMGQIRRWGRRNDPDEAR